MPDELNPEKLAEEIETYARELKSEMTDTHGPLWNHRLEIAKLLITLCSAILVATISFSGNFLNPSSGAVRYPSLLIISWLLTLLSLVLGLGSMWFHTDLLSFLPRFVNSIPEIKDRLGKIDKESTTKKVEIGLLVKEFADRSLEPVGLADKRAERALKLSMVCFCLGLVAFLAFGASQISKKPNPALNSDPACCASRSLS